MRHTRLGTLAGHSRDTPRSRPAFGGARPPRHRRLPRRSAAAPESAEKPADATPTGAGLSRHGEVRQRPRKRVDESRDGRPPEPGGARLTSFEEKDGWLRVKLADARTGWIRKKFVRKDDGCLPDRRELLLMPPMLRMSDGSGASGPKGTVVVEADIDETGAVKAVRVVKNETGSPDRGDGGEERSSGGVKGGRPVKKCRAAGFTYVYTRTF